MPLFHMAYHADQTYEHTVCQKLAPHVPPFKVTQGYWIDQLLPIIPIPDNFLLTFHSNIWPIVYHFQDTVRQAKYCKFLQTLVYLSSTSGGYP